MLYESNEELPAPVRKLPDAGKTIWREEFNVAIKTHKGNESLATVTAWSKVGEKYIKHGNKWIAQEGGHIIKDNMIYEQEQLDYGSMVVEYKEVDGRKRMVVNDFVLKGRLDSANGYPYKPRSHGDLVKLAEGHTLVNRGLTHFQPGEILGVARNVHEKGEKVVCDLVVNYPRAIQETMQFLVDEKPEGIATSIVGNVRWAGKPHKSAVERLTSLDTMDLVLNAATATSIFESIHPNGFDIDTKTKEEINMENELIIEMTTQNTKLQGQLDISEQKLQDSTTKIEGLELKVNEMEAAKRAGEKVAQIDSLIAESKLKPEWIDDEFKVIVHKQPDIASATAILEARKKFAASVTSEQGTTAMDMPDDHKKTGKAQADKTFEQIHQED